MNRTLKQNSPGANREITRLQQQLFAEGVVSRKLLDAIPSPLLIINEKWHVVYANGAVAKLVGKSTTPRPGLRVGEAFHCIHYQQRNKGPLSYQSCHVCGVARLLARSLKGEPLSEACHLTCDLAGETTSLDLHVWATPLEFHGEQFSILTLLDISDRRKRQLLEHACFHDLLNTLTSIMGVLAVVKSEKMDDQSKLFNLLEQMTQDSINEINTLRLLDKAEQKQLEPQFSNLASDRFLVQLSEAYQKHPAAEGKTLQVDPKSANLTIETDYQLLRRIIGNMLINAFEATEPGGTVRLGCRDVGNGAQLWVHNSAAIPQNIRDQIFFRDVSDKGHNRGIGTYSIKLLSNLLGGQPHFQSSEEEGTTFSVWLPYKQSKPQGS
ncbi:MAG: PAS domain-containing sensor histidine kinase [Deltaproteobacteria bacterium]|jgi:signal transduction histidine kinase|nr:PAS domain-containing sensor histidine kinase [Deltaproteobacteria bacterium]